MAEVSFKTQEFIAIGFDKFSQWSSDTFRNVEIEPTPLEEYAVAENISL